MIGKIFAVLCIASVVFSAVCGDISQMSGCVFDGAERAVSLTVSLVGTTCFFCGCMNVLEGCGLIKKLSKTIHPILRAVFPQSAKSGVGINEIASNVSANILGLGNAATALGLGAMKELKKLSDTEGRATDDMVMLVVLNTASIDILPTTLIALRRSCGSSDPCGIIIPVLLSSVCTTVFAVIITKIFSKIY